MEQKSYFPQFKAVDVDGTASWVMATLNEIDHDRDVTLKGFFGRQTFSIVPAHDHTHVPLGKADVREQGNEAIVRAKFNLDIPAARDWHSAIRFDFENPPAVQEYSYAYTVLAGGSKSGTFKGEPVRFLQPRPDGSPGVDVYETSPVLRGAGRTRTLAVKCDGCAGHVDPEVAAIAKAFHAKQAAEQKRQTEELAVIAARLQLCQAVDTYNEEMLKEAERNQNPARFHYSETAPPPPAHERAAWSMLKVCCAELGVDLPVMRWFGPITGAEGRYWQKYGSRDWPGFATEVPVRGIWNGAVWIAAAQPLDLILRTIAHEAAHAAGGDEDAAQAYERRWAENLPAVN